MQMPNDFSKRPDPRRTSHRQAFINAVLQHLQGTISGVRRLHGCRDLGDLPSAAAPSFHSLFGVAPRIEERLLYSLIDLDLRVILGELGQDFIGRARAKPFRMVGEILSKGSEDASAISLCHVRSPWCVGEGGLQSVVFDRQALKMGPRIPVIAAVGSLKRFCATADVQTKVRKGPTLSSHL